MPAPLRVRFDVSDLLMKVRAMQRTAARVEADLRRAVARALAITWTEAKAGAPVHTGALAGSIQRLGPDVATAGHGITVRAQVVTPLPYAVVMEEGRRPGAPMPPEDPIRRWVELKIRRGDIEGAIPTEAVRRRRSGKAWRDAEVAIIDALTFVIRRAIAAKGIAGRWFFRRAAEKGRAVLTNELGAIVREWARNGGTH